MQTTSLFQCIGHGELGVQSSAVLLWAANSAMWGHDVKCIWHQMKVSGRWEVMTELNMLSLSCALVGFLIILTQHICFACDSTVKVYLTFLGNAATTPAPKWRCKCFPTFPLHLIPLRSSNAGLWIDPADATTYFASTSNLSPGSLAECAVMPTAFFLEPGAAWDFIAWAKAPEKHEALQLYLR